jgi:hypothetical protein
LAGWDGDVEEHILAAKFERSFRETIKPLESLEGANSGDFRMQGYQGLSERVVLPVFSLSRELTDPSRKTRKIWNREKGFFFSLTH